MLAAIPPRHRRRPAGSGDVQRSLLWGIRAPRRRSDPALKTAATQIDSRAHRQGGTAGPQPGVRVNPAAPVLCGRRGVAGSSLVRPKSGSRRSADAPPGALPSQAATPGGPISRGQVAVSHHEQAGAAHRPPGIENASRRLDPGAAAGLATTRRPHHARQPKGNNRRSP